MNTKKYRFFSFFISIIFLALAFVSKYYKGKYWHFAYAYMGDLFIVACLYFWLTIVYPKWRPTVKALSIALLAVAVEIFQATGLPARLQLPEPFVFILGSQFDAKDFIYYLVGLLIALLVDYIFLKHNEEI